MKAKGMSLNKAGFWIGESMSKDGNNFFSRK
jgi:hypothetical protein